jgi:hypothetical protein
MRKLEVRLIKPEDDNVDGRVAEKTSIEVDDSQRIIFFAFKADDMTTGRSRRSRTR